MSACGCLYFSMLKLNDRTVTLEFSACGCLYFNESIWCLEIPLHIYTKFPTV